MCTCSALILLVGEAGRSLSWRVAVVVARDGRLDWRGVAVVSSPRGGVRIGAPLIHREARGAIRGPTSKATCV